MATTKKAAARKPAAKKAAAKKPAAKKPAAKKPAARKPAARKPAARKAAPKKALAKSPRKTTRSSDKKIIKGTCFTIMPFGNWFDDYYESIYVPAIKSSDLNPRRADDLYRPSAIVHDIWAMTQEAKVILADLSNKNPNVFYELGLAHAIAKPVILVTASMEDVPFDLRSLRVLLYDKNDPDWGDVLKHKITRAIREILATPMEAVLPAFLKVKKSADKKSISKEGKELISLRQELDIMKLQMQNGPRSRIRPRKLLDNAVDAENFAERYLKKYPSTSDEELIEILLEEGVPEEKYAIEVLRDVRRKIKS